jgi:hypothetical protein
MADKDKKRKYLLFSGDDGRPSSEKPCAFFASPEGCKNGDGCKFSHALVKEVAAQPPIAVSAAPAKSKKERSSSSNPQSVPLEKVAKPDNGTKRKHSEQAAASALSNDTNTSSNKKVKIDESKNEIQMLREEMRRQQEFFEQKLSSIVKEVQHQ